jgi:FkbM family methyltransferase
MIDTLVSPSPLQTYRGYAEADVHLLQDFCVPDRRPEPGFIVDFLGVRTRVSSLATPQRASEGVLDIPVPGDYHAEAIEYVGLLESVVAARRQFVALELGAGWGPWLVAGAKAAQMRGLVTIRLYGVEADPQHFEFMVQHFLDNGLDPGAHHLFKAAVGLERGQARWPKIADAANDWGSRPARVDGGTTNEQDAAYLGGLLNDFIEVEVLPVSDILEREERWDLVHIDVQGWERLICEHARAQFNARVAHLVIGTHSRKLDGDLVDLFHREGWILEHEKPTQFRFMPGAKMLESMNLADGTQVWRNPALSRA